MVTPDGMPIVWISRLMGHRQVERVYGPDLMLAVCEQSVSLSTVTSFTADGPRMLWKNSLCECEKRFQGIEIVGT